MIWGLLNLWVLIAIGKALEHFKILKSEDSQRLNQLVFFVTMPALIFLAIYKIPSFGGMVVLPLAGISGFLVFTGLASATGRFLRLKDKTLGGFVLCAGQPNSMYIAFPVILTLLGAEAMPMAIIYASFTPIMMATFFTWIAAYYGEKDHRLEVKDILNPLTASFLLGLLLNLSGIGIPTDLLGILDQVSSLTTPLILISLGLALKFNKNLISELVMVCGALKLLIAPAIAWLIASTFGITGLAMKVVILELSMPPALVNMVLAIENKLDTEFVDGAVFSLTAASMVTLPVLAYLLG